MSGIVRSVMALGAVGCIVLSCFFAFEFGFTRGTTPELRWAFGALAAFLDLAKSGILIVTADAGRSERRAAVAAFVFLTSMSLWCAGGVTAVQLAERVTNQVVATAQQTSKQAVLDRLLAQRNAIGDFKETTDDAVETARAAVTTATAQADAERARGYCGKLCRDREADERAARTALLLAQTNRAATVRASELEAKIEVAQKEVDDVERQKTATKDADPQAKSMAKVFGASEDLIALIGHAIFAIGVEIGSGLLPWLLFGHGRREETLEIEPSSVSTALVPAAATPLVETPESVRQRFFDEVVIPSDQYVPAARMYMAYARWCMERGFNPMGSHAFGRAPPWGKQKKGGQVKYLNCSLAEAYNAPPLRLAVSNT